MNYHSAFSDIVGTEKNTMPRTLPWLTGDAVKREATPQKRAIKRDPDPDSDRDKTPKASQDVGYSEKSDILKSCKHFPYHIICDRHS